MAALFDIEALRSDEGFGGDWGWWKDPRSRAHILNSGPHNIDLCRWWLGDDIVSVVAHCGTFREENPNENTTMAMWGFAGGAMASFWSSSVCPSPGFDGEDFRFRLMGDEGIIDAQPFGKIRVGRGGEWELAYEQPHVPLDDADAAFVSDGRMQAYTDQVQAFVDSGEERSDGFGGRARERLLEDSPPQALEGLVVLSLQQPGVEIGRKRALVFSREVSLGVAGEGAESRDPR